MVSPNVILLWDILLSYVLNSDSFLVFKNPNSVYFNSILLLLKYPQREKWIYIFKENDKTKTKSVSSDIKKRKQKCTLDHGNATSYSQVAGIHLIFTCACVLTEAAVLLSLLHKFKPIANRSDF